MGQFSAEISSFPGSVLSGNQQLDEAGEHFKLESEKIPGRAAVIHNFPLLALKKLKKPLNMFGHWEKIQRLALILWREATSARINLNA